MIKKSREIDMRLPLMPTYLKMTLLPKVTMTLKWMTGKTQAADTTLTLQNLSLVHVIMHLQNVLVPIYYCSDWA
jgi:hypothetical protein